MRLPLPELDTIRDNSEASPKRWTRNCAVTKFGLHAGEFLFEKRTSCNCRALRRCPCTEAALTRTRLKIRVRFAARQFVHTPFDAQLPLERRPVKRDRCVRVAVQVGCLTAVVVREKHKTAAADAPIQHDTHRRTSSARSCRKCHRLRQRL